MCFESRCEAFLSVNWHCPFWPKNTLLGKCFELIIWKTKIMLSQGSFNITWATWEKKIQKVNKQILYHQGPMCTNGLFYHPTTICTGTFWTNCIALLSWCNCTDSFSFVPNALSLKSYFALPNCQLFILHLRFLDYLFALRGFFQY